MKQENLNIKEFQKYLYLTAGFLLVIIGTIGIFLPVLPTTIFLILASICFVKSSPRANEWLKNHKLFGMYIRNYQEGTGFTIRAKIFNIVFLWLMISFSAFYLTNELHIKIILYLIAIGVTIHILAIKTKK